MTDNTLFFNACEQASMKLLRDDAFSESVQIALLEEGVMPEKVIPEVIVAQWLMQRLQAPMSTELIHDKRTFLEIAEHMGPDYVQALYHAVKWMTRVV